MNTLLVIPGEMTDLNTYVNANRTSRFKGAAIKKEETERVSWECKVSRIPKFDKKVIVKIRVWTANNKKDEDNYFIYAKWILDGMKNAGVIQGDGVRWVHVGQNEVFYDGKGARTEVEIIQP